MRGEFQAFDAVKLVDRNGVEIARGLANYGTPELIRLIGKNTDEIHDVLGFVTYECVINRRNIAITGDNDT